LKRSYLQQIIQGRIPVATSVRVHASVESLETELVNRLRARDAMRRVDVGTGCVATSTDDEEDYSTVNSVGAVASSKQVDEEGEILTVETLYRALSYNPTNP
jgi:hypothetical protein